MLVLVCLKWHMVRRHRAGRTEAASEAMVGTSEWWRLTTTRRAITDNTTGNNRTKNSHSIDDGTVEFVGGEAGVRLGGKLDIGLAARDVSAVKPDNVKQNDSGCASGRENLSQVSGSDIARQLLHFNAEPPIVDNGWRRWRRRWLVRTIVDAIVVSAITHIVTT